MEYHILSHTRWNRESYRTLQQFHRRFLRLMDNLLELLESEPGFEHFHLDGQSILLEDYLISRPENEKRLKALIKQGKISVGPWYVVSDHQLTCGEAIIRNLQYGHRVAADLGKVCKVGYLPEQFGNISQLPQILQGFRIGFALFTRGYSPGEGRKSEIEWQSPDGSQVFALYLGHGISNFVPASSDPKEVLRGLQQTVNATAPHLSSSLVLLMNGGDHFAPQQEIVALIKALNKLLPKDKVVHTSLEDYFKKLASTVKKPEIVKGELREDQKRHLLANTLSTRSYLKEANYSSQIKLLTAESAHLCSSLMGEAFDSTCLQQAWKLLLNNHSIHSLAGCGLDQVHREMMYRFQQVDQMADELCSESLALAGSHLKYPETGEPALGLLLFNPSSAGRHFMVETDIEIPLKTKGATPKQISILDEQGHPVPFNLSGTSEKLRRTDDIHTPPSVERVQQFSVQIPMDMEGLEYRSFQVVPVRSKVTSAPEKVRSGNNRLENNLLQVMVGGDGSVAIRHKPSGHLFGPLLVFEDDGDVGDCFLHRSPQNDRVVSTHGRPAQIRQVAAGPYHGVLQIERILPIPVSADIQDERRLRDTVDCVVSTRITLVGGDPVLYCETRMDNRALYHRLRCLFQTNLESSEAFSDSAFDIIRRPAQLPEAWKEGTRQYPMQSFMGVEKDGIGLAVFTRGIHEYQLIDPPTGKLALTLLRCVGLISRLGDPCYEIEVPEAQCLGIQRFQYALCPYSGEEQRMALPGMADAYLKPVVCKQFVPAKGKQPRRRQLASVSPSCIQITALKRCENRDGILLRMVNFSSDAVQAQVTSGWPIKEAYQLDMLEDRKGKLLLKAHRITLPMRPKEIATLELVV